jgi:pilus assembly protein CpaE
MSKTALETDPFDDFDALEEPFGQAKAKSSAFASDDPFQSDYDEPDHLSDNAHLAKDALAKAQLTPQTQAVMVGDDLGSVSIPRIGIHFFPDNEATLKACDTAALDRRMSRTQCLVRRGGLEEAIAVYQNEPTPSLVIVESLLRGRDLLDRLDSLAEVCDEGTKVVVIGATNDISLFRELMRQGVSEYIVAPIQPLTLIKVISGLFSDPDTPFAGRTIAFIGARGGAGSSVLAHNFAYALSESMQANTVIADYDLAFGTAGLDFNQDPLQGMAEALNEPDRLDSVLLDRMLTKCSERLSLFSAPAALDQDYMADEEAFAEVTRKVRASAPFIVMDLPHIWSPWLKNCLVSADDVVIVATPDLASLRNAKNMIDLLKSYRPNDKPPRVVLNQTEMPGRPEIPRKDFTAALGIEPICSIPFDPKTFGVASNNGQMIGELAPNSRANEALADIVMAITGRARDVKKPSGSLLSKLFKK